MRPSFLFKTSTILAWCLHHTSTRFTPYETGVQPRLLLVPYYWYPITGNWKLVMVTPPAELQKKRPGTPLRALGPLFTNELHDVCWLTVQRIANPVNDLCVQWLTL